MHKIGYFVNNHGSGHLNRLYCLDRELRSRAIDYKLYVFAEHINKIYKLDLAPNTKFVKLPVGNWDNKKKHLAYHSLPSNYIEYFSPIVKCCIDNKIDTFVSDLSVEVGLAVRLHVKKLIYVLLHGARIDITHELIFTEADKLLVPFSGVLQDGYFKEIDRKFGIKYSGGFLKFQYQPQTDLFPVEYCHHRKNILIILGTGGDNFDSDYINVDPSQYNVVVLGKEHISNITTIPFANPYNYLRCADVVVGNAGDSIMHEVAYFNKPYICIPEERPFEEQIIKGDMLEKYNFALLSTWQSFLSEDLQRLKPQTSKKSLVKNDRAKLYADEILY